MLAEVAFEPIDRRKRRRSGVTKRAKTQRPRNYAFLALRIPIAAQERIGDFLASLLGISAT
jgi:hypothetical protein